MSYTFHLHYPYLHNYPTGETIWPLKFILSCVKRYIWTFYNVQMYIWALFLMYKCTFVIVMNSSKSGLSDCEQENQIQMGLLKAGLGHSLI